MHSFTYSFNEPTLHRAVRARRAADAIPHCVELAKPAQGQPLSQRPGDTQQTPCSGVNASFSPRSLGSHLPTRPKRCSRPDTWAWLPAGLHSLSTDERGGGVHCAHHVHIGWYFLKCVSGRGSGRACVFFPRSQGLVSHVKRVNHFNNIFTCALGVENSRLARVLRDHTDRALLGCPHIPEMHRPPPSGQSQSSALPVYSLLARSPRLEGSSGTAASPLSPVTRHCHQGEGAVLSGYRESAIRVWDAEAVGWWLWEVGSWRWR